MKNPFGFDAHIFQHIFLIVYEVSFYLCSSENEIFCAPSKCKRTFGGILVFI